MASSKLIVSLLLVADRSQLFNLLEDPLEVNNLYYNSNYQSIRDSLLQLIADWQREVRDTLRL